MPSSTSSPFRRSLILFLLILAGEAIFLLPFAIPRIFRPSFLEVFGVNNLELGLAFSAYGTVAMIAYLFGGPLADLFPPRKLMGVALLSTALGGVALAFIPSKQVLVLIYGAWGLTTILLFWAALIRATREWGGDRHQGKAYGFLDSGRGLLAAVVASAAVAIFSFLLPTDRFEAGLEVRTQALQTVIWLFTGIVGVVGILVWWLIPDPAQAVAAGRVNKIHWKDFGQLLRRPTVWLQALIILCAYVGYKGVDDFALYAYDVHGYDDVQAARIGTLAFWIRPIAALAAGFIGDRKTASWGILVSFGILCLGSLLLASGGIQPGVHWMLILTIAATCVGIYALRGLYFALLQEARVPLALTGTAVGLVSIVGYTRRDIFMGPLMGYLLDRSPGAVGHSHVFLVLAGFALVGLVGSWGFRRVISYARDG
jgi:MFS family permease